MAFVLTPGAQRARFVQAPPAITPLERTHPRASAAPSSRPVASPTSTNQKREVRYTSLANNTFVLQYKDVRLLIDPWLVDDLIFYKPGFYRGKKPPSVKGMEVAGRYDAVILTQYLPDHAHPPTLRKIPRSTPVLAPQQALPLLNELGFTNVRVLNYGDTIAPVQSAPGVEITAGRGSVVGPPGSPHQLALVFSFADTADSSSTPLTVYHEPHGMHDNTFLAKYKGKLDVAIAPIVKSKFPILLDYAIVNGSAEALKLCKAVKPRAFMGFDNSGGGQTGFLAKFLAQTGGMDEFKGLVAKEKDLANMELLFPERPLQPLVIARGETI